MTHLVHILNYLLYISDNLFALLRVILVTVCVDTGPSASLYEEVQGSMAVMTKKAPTFRSSQNRLMLNLKAQG